MTDKATKETVARLKAYAECFRKKTGRTSMIECFENLCDGCTLNYAQGTAGEHLKDIETAIRVLEKELCEDAVSRQRVIEELRYMDNNGFITRSVNHVVDDIRSIPSVKSLENQPRWIPVSERLPEDNTLVLVTVKVGNREPKVRSGSYYMDGYFHIDNGDCWNSRDKELLAWLPLPEPYKGDEDD